MKPSWGLRYKIVYKNWNIYTHIWMCAFVIVEKLFHWISKRWIPAKNIHFNEDFKKIKKRRKPSAGPRALNIVCFWRCHLCKCGRGADGRKRHWEDGHRAGTQHSQRLDPTNDFWEFHHYVQPLCIQVGFHSNMRIKWPPDGLSDLQKGALQLCKMKLIKGLIQWP